MSFRLTYVEAGFNSLEAAEISNGILLEDSSFISSGKVEIREDDGAIIRLGPETSFRLFNSPLGLRPEYGRGEVILMNKGNGGKYRTSCYIGPANSLSARPDIFIKPGKSDNVDEFYAVRGDVVIFEFDENFRTFTICTVREGEKALITFDSAAESAVARYSSEIQVPTDEECDYILRQYLDRRRWVQ